MPRKKLKGIFESHSHRQDSTKIPALRNKRKKNYQKRHGRARHFTLYRMKYHNQLLC